MPITIDPNDPRLKHKNSEGQNEVYLVLSDEERAKEFVRPVRYSYIHTGKSPKYPLRELNEKEKAWGNEFVKFETYPEGSVVTGRYWTQEEIDNINNGCGTVTTMGTTIAETYARNPHFYGRTYCAGCNTHLPVDEFKWAYDDEVVGS